PPSANVVSFELPPGYSGDPDLHVSHNKTAVVDDSDCMPWKSAGKRERCEFRGDDLGGTYSVLINPYRDYADAAITVHYSWVNPNNNVANSAPIAKSGKAYSGLQDSVIAFSSNGSADIDGTIDAFNWHFGDGNSSADANPQHSYAAYGEYNATLTVTDNDGATHTSKSSVLVGRPTGYCAASGDNKFEHIQNVVLANLNNTSNAAETDGYQDFTALTAHVVEGENSLTVMGAGPISDSEVEHWTVWIDFNGNDDFADNEVVSSFAAQGVTTQNITIPAGLKGLTTTMRIAMKYEENALSACGDLGYGEYEDYTVHVNSDPIAQSNGSYKGTVGQAISFSSAGSTDADGDIATYHWDFGNGDSSAQANPAYTYTASGTFEVTLTVTDSNGVAISDSTAVSVTASEPAKAAASGGSLGFISTLLMLLIAGFRRYSKG
ncbi:MAG: PKD domain-containing protein, partial [Psychrosphaera sp.]|nr:PKD domain-containing protein [Psychrosphaera sp.]